MALTAAQPQIEALVAAPADEPLVMLNPADSRLIACTAISADLSRKG